VERGDCKVKGCTCANVSSQQGYINKEDAESPTVATESIAITATIEVKQGRDIMTIDVPNAFIQTNMKKIDGNRVIMKICGPLEEMLVSQNPELYSPFVTQEHGEPILYVELLKALYGTLKAALSFYKKLKKALEGIGYKINPHNRLIYFTLQNSQYNGSYRVSNKSYHSLTSIGNLRCTLFDSL
jgi:hypothetical protein